MTATNRFISVADGGDIRIGNVTEGSSSTATAYVELRMLITKADGTTATTLTDFQVKKALEVFWQYLKRGGINEFVNGTGGLPLPGPAP